MRHLNFSRLLALTLTIALLAAQPAILPVRAQTVVDFTTIARATVYITSVYEVAGRRVVSCTASGTLVSADGLILTNAHAVVDSERCRVEDIAISVAVRLTEPPVLTYYAEVVSYDLGLDLAVLRIAQLIDGRRVEMNTLSLPFVELGDSRRLRLDDTITVFGYEGIGDQTITLSRGTIIGFIAEARGGEQAWLKTSATILGPMAGGGAYNSAGQLIGIPTTAPASDPAAVLDCRQVQDTNGDGLVDSRDRCIPVGGFINALRPSHLARGLVRAARLGIIDGGHMASAQVAAAAAAAGEPSFGPIFFAPSINEAGQPTMFVTRLPSGASSLYLCFEYRNMRPGITYELRTTRNGDSAPAVSQAPMLWSGGVNGFWYIGSSGQVWQNGVYEFALLIEGRVVQTARITIGGAPEPTPSFSDIVFGLLDSSGNVIGSGYTLGVSNVVSARFIFRDMMAGLPWAAIWYYEGIELRRDGGSWNLGPSGSQTINITGDLLPGRYRLELYVEDRLTAAANLILAGGQEGVFARILSNPRFSSSISGGSPGGPVTESFSAGISDLYAFVDWQQLAPGTPWTYRWLVDGEVFFEHTEAWAVPESGADFWVRLSSERGLPDGAYRLDILLGGQLFISQVARVGLGQLPVTTGNLATGVQAGGVVVDALTGEGIPGVLFIVLKAQFSVADFVWDESQVFGMSMTDSRGRFELDRLLPYGELYSVVIVTDGYLPVVADAISLDPADPELVDGRLEFRLELNRDLTS